MTPLVPRPGQEAGQSLAEYSLVIALVAVVAVAVVTLLGLAILGLIGTVSGSL